MVLSEAAAIPRKGRLRYSILLLVFFIAVINLADCAIISIVDPAMLDELQLDAAALGYILSVQSSGGSFASAPVFAALNALGALGAYLLVVGEIRRVTLKS